MSSEESLDYYAVLGVSSNATEEQIRNAYIGAALKTHPDRVPSDSPERAERTRKFQIVNDAYYTLSDRNRRHDYDSSRKDYCSESDKNYSHTPGNFPWSRFGFGSKAKTEEEKEELQSKQFGNIFEEILRDEGMSGQCGEQTGRFWSIVGGLSGATLGFIFANFPGLIAGAAAGNRLGAVRDTRGKSVYAVFQELPAADKAKLLGELAAKVLSHTIAK